MENKILLIIPAYNEGRNILNTCNNIREYNQRLDYIIINDGSTDDTAEVCKINSLNHINLIHNLGIGGAVQTGYKYAYENSYDIAIQFDGDGQHDITCLENLITPITSGEADLVIGSRFIGTESRFKSTTLRRLGIKTISVLIKLFTGFKIHDTTSGFRACNRELIAKFADDYPTEYPEPISEVVVLKEGYKIKEVPAQMNERTEGISSIKTWKSVYYMINVILSIFIAGLRRYKR